MKKCNIPIRYSVYFFQKCQSVINVLRPVVIHLVIKRFDDVQASVGLQKINIIVFLHFESKWLGKNMRITQLNVMVKQ